MPKAIIYSRVSTEEQANEGKSLEVQIDICHKWAENNGIVFSYDADDSPKRLILELTLKAVQYYIKKGAGGRLLGKLFGFNGKLKSEMVQNCFWLAGGVVKALYEV